MSDGLKRISTALGMLAGLAASSHAQTPATSGNQATANAVAGSLSASKVLSKYRIDIETNDGLVTLTGTVASRAQRAEALARARKVAGVSEVVDHLNVVGDRRVRPAQYQTAFGGHRYGGGYPGGEVIYDGAPAGVAQPTMGVPMAEGPAGMTGGTQAAIPGQPNYAWPGGGAGATYPTTYPWQAWATATPPYPNPEIPLDWRAVTLRWDDGIWWLDFRKNYTRPFFTPWPFQIFGY